MMLFRMRRKSETWYKKMKISSALSKMRNSSYNYLPKMFTLSGAGTTPRLVGGPMKPIHYLLLSLTVFMSGCLMSSLPMRAALNSDLIFVLSSDSALDKSKAASLTRLYIVPIEGAPMSTWQTTTAKIDSLSNKNEIWEPSNEVAKITKHHLETVDNYSITIAPDVEPLPGVESWEVGKRKMNWNWYIPVKNWYNEDTSSIDYMEQPNSDIVMEVSTPENSLYFELRGGVPVYNGSSSSDRYILWISMKLVDTASRTVLANATCVGLWPPKLNFLELHGFGKIQLNRNSLFANGGSVFKEMFHKTAELAVPECIKSLGMQKK